MLPADRELEVAARVLAGRALLARACAVLAERGIVPVVLKGVLISALTEGSGEPPRDMIDVDLLVRPRERRTAEDALREVGLEVLSRSRAATTLRDHELGIDLDLHERLTEPELFTIDPDSVIDRAREERALFGCTVQVPDRHDLYAHLVAHFARNRSNARDVRRLRDLAVVARALPMEPDVLADHLLALGLGRAARYVLPLAVARGDRFAAAVLAALPRDRVGEVVARGVERWLERFAGNHPLAVPALHALNRSLPAGARSLAAHVARGARSRVLERAPVRR